MPIYKFRCENNECDHVTEFLHLAKVQPDGKVASDPCPESAVCETCGGPTHKVFEAPGMVRVSFERNGRKATEIRTDTGGKRIVSGTREKYEHEIGNKNSKDLKGYRVDTVYTKEVQREKDRIKKERKL